jgi:hypothetical protein
LDRALGYGGPPYDTSYALLPLDDQELMAKSAGQTLFEPEITE